MNTRNWKFDYLKGIACLIVVLLHCPLYGILGDLVIYALRFSVPIFFMITGYYSYLKDSDWIKKKAFYLFKMLALTELLYFLWYLVKECALEHVSVLSALNNVTAFQHVLRSLLCGTFFNSTLWYLYAGFWTYLIFLLFHKFHVFKHTVLCLLITGILICVQIIGRFYFQNHYDIAEHVYLFRNALTFGLPLTLLGRLLGHYEALIREKISLAANIGIFVFGIALMVLEYIFSRQYMDFHFSTLFISIGMFLFAFTYQKPNFLFKKSFSYIGRSLSLWIYLIHYFFITLLDCLFTRYLVFGFPIVYQIMRPLLVCALSIGTAALINKILHSKK